MKTRITALLLALVMAVCCLTGCTSTRVRSYSEESSDASTDKYAAALDAYKSNKKVMTINGSLFPVRHHGEHGALRHADHGLE